MFACEWRISPESNLSEAPQWIKKVYCLTKITSPIPKNLAEGSSSQHSGCRECSTAPATDRSETTGQTTSLFLLALSMVEYIFELMLLNLLEVDKFSSCRKVSSVHNGSIIGSTKRVSPGQDRCSWCIGAAPHHCKTSSRTHSM